MCKKLVFLCLLIMVLGVFNSAMADVIMRYRFDGVIGETPASPLTDDTSNVQFVIPEDSYIDGTVTYDAPNPFYNTGGTSLRITPFSGLESSADGNDVLDLSIPQYTLEMYFKIDNFLTDQTAGLPHLISLNRPQSQIIQV
jgi:hypothetical protein